MSKIYHYYVEGECEQKLINELKKAGVQKLVSGKVEVLNVITEIISDIRLLALNKKTIIILVYDIDKPITEILERNIKKLKKYGFTNVVHIQSIKNFEDEIIFSTTIKKINDLFNTQGVSDFKNSFISHKNILNKLNTVNFDHEKIWSRVNYSAPFSKYSNSNDLNTIKIKH